MVKAGWYQAGRTHFFLKEEAKTIAHWCTRGGHASGTFAKFFWFFLEKMNCLLSVEYGTAAPFRRQTCKSLPVAPKGATGDAPPLPAVPGLFRRTIPSATRAERS
jgi:hypothetical protein